MSYFTEGIWVRSILGCNGKWWVNVIMKYFDSGSFFFPWLRFHIVPVTRSFYIFFDLRLNKRLNKQWWGCWFNRTDYDVTVMSFRLIGMAFGDKICVLKITWYGWPYLFMIMRWPWLGNKYVINQFPGISFVDAPSQWEMTLHCNAASDWLGAYTKWSLNFYPGHSYIATVRTSLLKDRPWRISMHMPFVNVCLWYPCKMILVRVISKVTCVMTRHFAKINCNSRLHNDVINRNAPCITVHF